MKRQFALWPTIFSAFVCIAFAGPQTDCWAQTAGASMSQRLPQGAAPTTVPNSCPVTQPPARPFAPPSPYPKQTGEDGFWFGTGELWIRLPKDGTWKGLPHYTPEDPSFRQKLFWWREGYDWHKDNPPHLQLSGERLDTSAPPMQSDEHANAGWTNDPHHPFIVTGINIPTLGCWKVTGRYEHAELSFVVWVTQ